MPERMIGQEGPRNIVRKRVAGRSAAHAYLFHGEAHLGKETLARLFARALNCPTRDACGTCDSCRAIGRGVHPLVSEVRRDWGDIPVQTMRDRVASLAFTAPEGATKFLLVNDAGNLNVSSANMLLKTLEEPPPATVIVLVTERPERLLPTIRSRCEPVAFGRVPRAALAAALPEDAPDPEALLDAADGRPGILRILLEEGVPPVGSGDADLIRLVEETWEFPGSVDPVARLGPAGLDFDPLRRFLIGRAPRKATIAAALLAAAAAGPLLPALAVAACITRRIGAFFHECEARVDELLKARADGLDPQAAKALAEEAKSRCRDFLAAEIHDMILHSVRRRRNDCVAATDPGAARDAARDLESLGAIRDAHRRDGVNSDGLLTAAVCALRRRRLEKP